MAAESRVVFLSHPALVVVVVGVVIFTVAEGNPTPTLKYPQATEHGRAAPTRKSALSKTIADVILNACPHSCLALSFVPNGVFVVRFCG